MYRVLTMRGKSRVIDCTHHEREEQGDGLYRVLTMRGKSRVMDCTHHERKEQGDGLYSP